MAVAPLVGEEGYVHAIGECATAAYLLDDDDTIALLAPKVLPSAQSTGSHDMEAHGWCLTGLALLRAPRLADLRNASMFVALPSPDASTRRLLTGARTLFEQAQAAARANNDAERAAIATTHLHVTRLLAGEAGVADELLEVAHELGVLEARVCEGIAGLHAGKALVREGRWSMAETAFSDGYDLMVAIGARTLALNHAQALLSLQLHTGATGRMENTLANYLHIRSLGAQPRRYSDIALDDAPARDAATTTIVSAADFSQPRVVDTLTGTLTRQTFLARLPTLGTSGGVLAIARLERFGRLSNLLGYSRADFVLQVVAARLCRAAGTAVAGRLGHAEFAFYWPEPQVADVTTLAADTRHTVMVGDESVSIDVGFGLAHDSLSRNAESLIAHAYAALAKPHRTGALRWFHDQDDDELQRRTAIEQCLARSAPHDFQLLYQPIVNLASGEVECFEVLTRWSCPSIGPVPPSEFFAVADDVGRGRELTELVMDRALSDCARFALPGVAINISPQLFGERLFAEQTIRRVGRSGTPASKVTLELLETALLPIREDGHNADNAIEQLVEAGISLAIDDFGTGTSNLSRLVDLPVTSLKIAQRFVEEVNVNPKSRALIRSIAQFAHEFGTDVVGEGVETVEQLEGLAAVGCLRVQGYLIARPMQIDHTKAFIREWPDRWLMLPAV